MINPTYWSWNIKRSLTNTPSKNLNSNDPSVDMHSKQIVFVAVATLQMAWKNQNGIGIHRKKKLWWKLGGLDDFRILSTWNILFYLFVNLFVTTKSWNGIYIWNFHLNGMKKIIDKVRYYKSLDTFTIREKAPLNSMAYISNCSIVYECCKFFCLERCRKNLTTNPLTKVFSIPKENHQEWSEIIKVYFILSFWKYHLRFIQHWKYYF